MAENINGYYRINNNGKVSQGQITDKNYKEFFGDSILEDFNSCLGSLFNGSPFSLLADNSKQIAPRYNKSVCSNQFPPSSKFVNENKELVIQVAATGCSEDDIYVEIGDGTILIQFQREPNEQSAIYDQHGLKLATNEQVMYKFNNLYHDPNKVSAECKNGLLTIVMQPREEVKPLNKVVFGKKIESKQAKTEED